MLIQADLSVAEHGTQRTLSERRRPFGRALQVLVALSILGVLCALLAIAIGIDEPHPRAFNIFFYLFTHYEPTGLVLLMICCVALYHLGVRQSEKLDALQLSARILRACERAQIVWLAAAAVALIGFIGWLTVYHRYPFAMDEFGAVFQSQLFARGRLLGELPAPWFRLAHWVTPVFINYDVASHTLISAYLPVFAALRAPFELIGAGGLLNPLLGAAGIIAVARVARRLWGSSSVANASALLLASSPQLLVMNMSAYSMPAHLLFNMLWLELYLRRDRPALLALPVLGFLALGIHQFVPHALFAAPFLLRTVLERRYGAAAYLAVTYAAGLAFWMAWYAHFAVAGAAESIHQGFGLPGPLQLLTQLLNLALLVSWQSALLGALAIFGLFGLRDEPTVARDIAASVALTLAFYVFVRNGQGHGWGYRYAYPVLGNVALLAGLGFRKLALEGREPRAWKLVFVGTVLSLGLQLPLRLYEVDEMVGPFARAERAIESAQANAVIVPTSIVWYGQDLIRNDPQLKAAPKVVSQRALTRAALALIEQQGTARVVSAAELRSYGLQVTDSP